MLTAQKITHADHTDDDVTLDYDARFLRRKLLMTNGGRQLLIDLPKTTSLNAGDAFEASDGTLVGVVAAPEPLIEVTGQKLHRLAWHIGNRHTPCQIEDTRLLIQSNHVMAQMLEGLGANTREVIEPFTPEGGAYGHGRTHGHDHTAQHGPENSHRDNHEH